MTKRVVVKDYAPRDPVMHPDDPKRFTLEEAETPPKKKKVDRIVTPSASDEVLPEPRAGLTPAQALAEFKVSCQIWLAKMDPETQKVAVEYAARRIMQGGLS
jgi:hypothetical protein